MSVYNGEKFLPEAVESMLLQSYKNFEFIIIDDGSTDATADILLQYGKRDPRITLIKFNDNQGLAASLNFGFDLARGDYIARMDADDISLSSRLEEQVLYLDEHPDIGICGTWVELIGESVGKLWKYPISHEAICVQMFFANALLHSSVMFRRSILVRHGLKYDTQFRFAQDYDLWSRAFLLTRFANIDHFLIKHRVYKKSSGAQNLEMQDQTKSEVHRRMLSLLEVDYTPEEFDLHEQICTYNYGSAPGYLHNSRKWLEKLMRANNKIAVFMPQLFAKNLGIRWTQICAKSEQSFFCLIKEIFSSPLPFEPWRWLVKKTQIDEFLLR